MFSAAINSSIYAEAYSNIHLPRYDELPKIDLYMDQLIDYLTETLHPFYQTDEKVITRSMVNNYVKQGVLSSAAGKKYQRHHLAYLIVICTLKQTFSISEIECMIKLQINSFDTHTAYDYYCTALEEALKALFGNQAKNPHELTPGINEGDFERNLVLASSSAVAYTLYMKSSVALALDIELS